MLSFNKIVNKMGKKGGKILFKRDIFEIIDPECKPQYDSYVNKTIYQLKSQGVILPIKSGVYVVPDRNDGDLNEVDLLEKYYIKLLKKYITSYVGSEYFVSGVKSLELHLKDYSVPEKIYVVTRGVNKKVKVGRYEIIFKTISGKYQGKKVNLFSKLSSFVKSVMIDDTNLKIACLELALLEASLVSDIEEGLQFDVLNKAVKKYGKVLDREVFYEVGKYKYGMSFNRLKEIAKPINQDLYQVFLDVIKKNGNLFIGEGLRGF